MKRTTPRARTRRNPVAKHAARLCRGGVHADGKGYRRQPKHKGREPFAGTVVEAVPAKGLPCLARAQA